MSETDTIEQTSPQNHDVTAMPSHGARVVPLRFSTISAPVEFSLVPRELSSQTTAIEWMICPLGEPVSSPTPD